MLGLNKDFGLLWFSVLMRMILYIQKYLKCRILINGDYYSYHHHHHHHPLEFPKHELVRRCQTTRYATATVLTAPDRR
jgi:hypothetical protein